MNLRLLAGLTLLAWSAQAQAQGWECSDRVDLPGGWSIMSQLYFEADPNRAAGPASLGPRFHVSQNDFYANWYPGLTAFDAPFVPPSMLSFVVPAETGTEARFGIFSAPGQTELKLAVSVSNPGQRGVPAQVLFQPKDMALNGTLLAQRNWSVRFLDGRGRSTGKVNYTFPFTLSELSSFYDRHIAAIRNRAGNLDTGCSEPEDISAVI